MYSRIGNDECLMCHQSVFKGISFLSLITTDSLCYSCRLKLGGKLKKSRFKNYPLYSIYNYENAKELLIRYKDYLDVPLGRIFLSPYIKCMNRIFKDYTIVLIPSSISMMKRRGFNHLRGMLEDCTLDIVECLRKEDDVQRFRKDRRLDFEIDESVRFDKVIIFDDVITSGNSILAALELLIPRSSKIVIFSVIDNYEVR